MGAEYLSVQRAGGPFVAYQGPGALRRFMRAGMARFRYPGSEAEQLLLAPQELRTADPSFVTEIYSGHFGLAGTYAVLNGKSPFDIVPPSDAWLRELHGFGWLRHLRAAGSELAQSQANRLFTDWVKRYGSGTGLPWRPDITGRRVISWLANSVVLLDTDDIRSYQIFLQQLTVQLRYLSAGYRDGPDGIPRLLALMALVYGGLCIAEQQAVVNRYVKPLSRELRRQILEDGGHISRNPMALVELLLDLLPLRQCFVARDRSPPEELTEAIDRAMRALRFFRLPDGSLARFNGTGATPADSLATVLAYNDYETDPSLTAANSAYGRLTRGKTTVICDFGPAPGLSVSKDAAAGCLSFEVTSGAIPIIVNCGMPGPEHSEWRDYARSTPAHTALSVEEASSAEFAGPSGGAPEAEAELSGPLNVTGEISEAGGALEMQGSHEGFRTVFGLRHTRQMVLAPTGRLISGKDMLTPIKGAKEGEAVPSYTIAFHLDPNVRATLDTERRQAALRLSNGEIWQISSNAPRMTLEESVYFGDERGPRESQQVVLSGFANLSGETRIVWAIEQVGEAPGASRPAGDQGRA